MPLRTRPTEPIGSIPRPLDLIEAVAQGDADDPALDPLYDAAIRDTRHSLRKNSGPRARYRACLGSAREPLIMQMQHDDEKSLLRSVAIQNAQSILVARRRAEQELVAAKEALELRTAR